MYGHLAADLDYSSWGKTSLVFRWEITAGASSRNLSCRLSGPASDCRALDEVKSRSRFQQSRTARKNRKFHSGSMAVLESHVC